jgi:hypothetical protein
MGYRPAKGRHTELEEGPEHLAEGGSHGVPFVISLPTCRSAIVQRCSPTGARGNTAVPMLPTMRILTTAGTCNAAVRPEV